MTTEKDYPGNSWFFDTRIPGDEEDFQERKHPDLPLGEVWQTKGFKKIPNVLTMYDTTDLLKDQVKIVLAIKPSCNDMFTQSAETVATPVYPFGREKKANVERLKQLVHAVK